ncbi:hypothetical protein Tco_0514753 [Tanacetum coccineum]
MDDLIRDRNAKLAAFQQEINTLKETLSNNVKEKESLSKTLTVFKTESKEKESKYIDKEIVLEKQNKETGGIYLALGYQNPFHLKKAQRIQPTLYDGSVIAKEHAVIYVTDDEETLSLEEESQSKMLDKQNDSISIEKKIKISLIDYSKLNKIKEDFGKRFVTQKDCLQNLWLKHSSFSETPVTSHTPVRIEAPSELPKVSLVNESLKKIKYQLANFDNVVKKRTTSDDITADVTPPNIVTAEYGCFLEEVCLSRYGSVELFVFLFCVNPGHRWRAAGRGCWVGFEVLRGGVGGVGRGVCGGDGGQPVIRERGGIDELCRERRERVGRQRGIGFRNEGESKNALEEDREKAVDRGQGWNGDESRRGWGDEDVRRSRGKRRGGAGKGGRVEEGAGSEIEGAGRGRTGGEWRGGGGSRCEVREERKVRRGKGGEENERCGNVGG